MSCDDVFMEYFVMFLSMKTLEMNSLKGTIDNFDMVVKVVEKHIPEHFDKIMPNLIRQRNFIFQY